MGILTRWKAKLGRDSSERNVYEKEQAADAKRIERDQEAAQVQTDARQEARLDQIRANEKARAQRGGGGSRLAGVGGGLVKAFTPPQGGARPQNPFGGGGSRARAAPRRGRAQPALASPRPVFDNPFGTSGSSQAMSATPPTFVDPFGGNGEKKKKSTYKPFG